MSHKPHKFAAGFTIVELLLALAITSLLLVAVAAAFHASITNYQENEDILQSTTPGRRCFE
jgi:prepilin-type N-terminal cleavage/methylation domain-containing protein